MIFQLKDHLLLNDLDDQWYYNTQILGSETTPKCPYCNRPRKFLGILPGYTKTCRCKECINKSRSEFEKKTFKENPEIRIESTRKGKETRASRTPERRKEVGDHIRTGQKSILESRGRKISAALNTPESKLRASNSRREMWKDPSQELLATLNNAKRGRKSKLYSADDGSEVYFDSSWERSFFLNISTKLDIKSIKRKVGFTISYYIPDEEEVLLEQGVEIVPHNYTPDFLLELTNGEIWVVEIKPVKDMDDIVVQSKIKYAVPYCQNLGYRYVIFNDDLTTPHFYC